MTTGKHIAIGFIYLLPEVDNKKVCVIILIKINRRQNLNKYLQDLNQQKNIFFKVPPTFLKMAENFFPPVQVFNPFKNVSPLRFSVSA